MTFDQFISDCSAALQTEINYLKTQGGTKHKITEGKLLRRHTGYTYLFTLSTEITLPDGSPIRVSFGKRTANGEVVSLDGFDVVLELDADLGEAIEEADLYSEPWKLLEELQVRLAEMIHSGETKLAKWVLTGKAPNRVETPSKNRLNEIIKRSRKNRTTYIWGPPGTGKTYTLSHISVYNLMKGTSILVLSHSNAAVDNIMIRIADILEKEKNAWKPGQVVRFGVPKVKEVLEHDTLLASRLVEHDNPDLKTKNSTLARQVSSLKEKVKRRNSALAKEELAKKEDELKELRALIRDMEDSYVQRAQVLGVTLSKATINSLIYERKFDLIIIDEVSMAYVPHVLFASSLGKRIVICGDFRQLPPIAQANDELVKKRLAVDIFKVTGIIKAVEKQQPVENLVMLDIQRRMHPKISRFSNHHFYDGRLKDHSSVIGREQIAQLEPYPGDAVALFDTTLCNTLTSKEFASRSKFNVLSAFIAIQLMGQARNSGIKEIGYICPYNAQSRLVSVLAQELLSEMQESNILCATVHKFQGSEREAIFYDTVDSYPQKMAGILHRSEDTGRLVNVALTRSKGKFVQISNQRYIKERLPKDNFTAQLVQYSGKWSSTTALKEIQSQLSRYKLKGLSWYFQDYMPELLRHIREAKSEIVICIPDGAHLDRAIWQALKELKRTVNKTIYSKNFSYSSAESHWDVIHWNHYLPLLVIDQAWIWYGVTTQDVVSCRVHAPKTARMLFGFLRLNLAKQSRAEIAATTMSIKPDLRLRDYVQNRSTCYVCGSRVLLKLSSKGKIYYQCDHCQSGGGIPLDVLDKYLTEVHLRCSKCKGNIEARLSKYGVYAKCSSCEETIDVRALW